MADDQMQWTTIAAGAVGTAIGVSLKFLLDLRKQFWVEQKEAAAPYVDELRKMFEEVRGHHAECLQQNAELREEVGCLRERVRNLECELSEMQDEIRRRDRT